MFLPEFDAATLNPACEYRGGRRQEEGGRAAEYTTAVVRPRLRRITYARVAGVSTHALLVNN